MVCGGARSHVHGGGVRTGLSPSEPGMDSSSRGREDAPSGRVLQADVQVMLCFDMSSGAVEWCFWVPTHFW